MFGFLYVFSEAFELLGVWLIFNVTKSIHPAAVLRRFQNVGVGVGWGDTQFFVLIFFAI